MNGTRGRIVTATAELFRRSGYHGTSLKEVMAAAAAPAGSIYHFFPGGKVQLAEAVVTETGATYRQLFELVAGAAPDPAAAISDFFDGAADLLAETDYVDICPVGSVAREVASTNETLRLAAAAVFDSWVAAAADLFLAAGLSAAEARELAETAVSLLEGGLILARTQRDADLLRRLGRQAHLLVATHLARPAAP